MSFSALIPVYYKESPIFLRDSLQSVFAQTLPPNEVVLVKDGKLTAELDRVCDEFAKKYPNTFKIVALAENGGLGRALNEGLKHCSYDLVARMDSDDICKPNRFEMQVQKFQELPELSLVGSWIDEFSTDPNAPDGQRRVPETADEIREFAKSKCPFNHPSVMFRKSAVLKVGGYQHFYLLEDYWLWARMIAGGMQSYNIQQPLVNLRGGSEMSARRGGLKYALSECRFQVKLKRLGLISYVSLVKNIVIRFTVRILPNSLRAFIYRKFLRSNLQK